jgi:superfamily II DNA or RNA helicase
MILRDYQETISTDAAKLLEWFKIAYLSMQVRTGKTATALMAAQKYGATSVLFVTKKKAISSIKQQDDEDAKGDYDKMLHLLSFKLICINYEQLHNLSPDYNFDLVVLDEAHCIGQFPLLQNVQGY